MLNFCHDPALSSWQEANARIILNLKHRRAAAKTNKGVWTWRLACVTARLAKHASVCWESVRQAKLGCFLAATALFAFSNWPAQKQVLMFRTSRSRSALRGIAFQCDMQAWVLNYAGVLWTDCMGVKLVPCRFEPLRKKKKKWLCCSDFFTVAAIVLLKVRGTETNILTREKLSNTFQDALFGKAFPASGLSRRD